MEEYRIARTAATQKLVEAGPQALVASFEESAAQLQDILESLQEADLAKPAQMARATIPIGKYSALRFTHSRCFCA